MSKKILVTGGAGFIGSHLVDDLINKKNHDVTILDILEEQVHGKFNNPPIYLNKKAKFIQGSVTNHKLLKKLVQENEVIYHLAADVGVGQSMYQIKKYTENNILGAATLLDIMVNCEHDVEKLIIASSNTIYGEGKAKCNECGLINPNSREINQLEKKKWELNCPKCRKQLKPILTDEKYPLNSSSIYALSKQAQEQMGLLIGKTYGINTTILRFFLVYGPRQALRNPYTGVCAIFANRLFHGKSPIIFEDGYQTRDFVNVKDVCNGLILSMEKKAAMGEIFNIGTGRPITIRKVAEIIAKKIDSQLKPIFNQNYRVGDIRHCVADITKIKNKLNFKPSIMFKDGIDDLIKWIKTQSTNIGENSEKAIKELKDKNLLLD